jgi:hypothetical protein
MAVEVSLTHNQNAVWRAYLQHSTASVSLRMMPLHNLSTPMPKMSSNVQYLRFAIVLLSIFSLSYASSDPPQNDYDFYNRRMKLLRRDNIGFKSLPDCAKPYCNVSAALSPSRLGCIEQTLTKACLCEKAVTPLACVPTGPSSEDNCWYDSENWLAGQCDKKVPVVPKTSMPACVQDCAINWMRKKGCRTDSRNCFCKLEGKELVAAVEQCKKASCMRHMSPGFDVAFWRDQVCAQGDTNKYNEDAYKAREKMVRTVRIVVPIFVVLVALGSIIVGNLSDDGEDGALCGAVVGAVLILCIIPPLFVAI